MGSREFRKFLAGAFFVSAGIQFYLYLAKVSVPLLGIQFILFGLCLYFGFIKKPKPRTSNHAVTHDGPERS
jgi:hypothetical protein